MTFRLNYDRIVPETNLGHFRMFRGGLQIFDVQIGETNVYSSRLVSTPDPRAHRPRHLLPPLPQEERAEEDRGTTKKCQRQRRHCEG